MINSEKIFSSLVFLIEISAKSQLENKNLRKFSKNNDEEWLKDFCTVKCSTAKGSGHTTAIRNLIDRNIFNSIGICSKTHIFNDEYSGYHENIYHIPINNISGTYFYGKLDAIIIDPASDCSQKVIDEIYKNLSLSFFDRDKMFFIFID